MDVKNCKKCKRLFNYIGGQQICPACREELEKKFQKVKQYLRDNRGASMQAVCENCDIEEKQVRQWIREERLEVTSRFDAGIVCKSCGTPIQSGEYCDKCKAGMINDLSSVGRTATRTEEVQKKAPATHENRMRFINTK